MSQFYQWTTTGVLQIRARPSTAHLDKLHAAWIREKEKPNVNLNRYYESRWKYDKAVDELFDPFRRGEVVPEGWLGSDFRLMLSPHRPNYLYWPEMTEVIMPFDICIYTPMAVSERMAEVLKRFGGEGRSVQLIPTPVYEESTGQFLGRFYLVHYLLRVPWLTKKMNEELEVVRIEIARSAVPDAPLFRVVDPNRVESSEEVVREDLKEALMGAGITGCRFVANVRIR